LIEEKSDGLLRDLINSSFPEDEAVFMLCIYNWH